MPIQEHTAPPGSRDVRRWRSPPLLRAVSFLPFALAIGLALVARSYIGRPMMTAESVGIPLNLVIGALTLAWAAFGALIVWTTSSRTAASLALVFITLPSIFAMILGPAIILILQNLP